MFKLLCWGVSCLSFLLDLGYVVAYAFALLLLDHSESMNWLREVVNQNDYFS